MSSRRTISNTFTVTTMDDPVSVQAQYSLDMVTIHTTWQDGDIYMRTKQSNETTWSSWHKIVGESGGETDYQFALSANLVTQDGTSATAPSDISLSAWQDAPMATTTQKPYLWSKVQKKDGNGNNVGSATYIRLTGEEGKDGLSPNPNILLRTVFDRGIDKVKEKWEANWSYVGIDGASDTIVDGRKCIRINASSLSFDIDFFQDVYGKLKTSTWYTLSFDSFSTHNFTTFIWDGNNSSGIVDRTAGCYIDGVFQSLDLGIDGSHEWTARWANEKRHSISFKTRSSFGTAHAYILFRCPSGAQVAICMPKLELGENATTYIANEDDLVGNDGQSIRGKIGRFFYYAGAWEDFASTDSFLVNDAQAPYFYYNNNYWVFNPETNGTYTKQDMGTPSSSSPNWNLITSDFKYIITEAIFGSYAHFGSAIINGDWLLSTHGKRNGNDSTEYTYFDSNDPMGVSSPSHFAPNFCVDLKNGESYQKRVCAIGGMRSPFTYMTSGGSFSTDFNDNVAVYSDSETSYSLPWDASQSGRKVVITNYYWNGNYSKSSGFANITAPSEKYFYEDGLTKSTLKLSREAVELLGYGDARNFYGWVVLKRIDLGTERCYGHHMKMLASGRVTGSSSGASVSYHTFDGSTMSVTRDDIGIYTLSWGNYNWYEESGHVFVMVCGYGIVDGGSSPVFASVKSQTKTSITVQTADDATRNDGAFNFFLMNFNDWIYL